MLLGESAAGLCCCFGVGLLQLASNKLKNAKPKILPLRRETKHVFVMLLTLRKPEKSLVLITNKNPCKLSLRKGYNKRHQIYTQATSKRVVTTVLILTA